LVSSAEGDRNHVQKSGDAEADLATGDAHQGIDPKSDVRGQGKSTRVQEEGRDSSKGRSGLEQKRDSVILDTTFVRSKLQRCLSSHAKESRRMRNLPGHGG
jgi:hypothetical protein